ncbi:quinone oxidoreductase isoform X1 [Hydra vulgaris]|uniref:quinone oxidoreductase isoform X1 n=1 Tax=Hydra vulgaris TaxID=6087 RepID=UPI0006410CA6|nr:quinone oxidoreductase-like isoform X1 [Hydra vulgaris]
MRGINVSEFGGPNVLKLVHNLPIPVPLSKQILVNVKAAGVNPVDTYIRQGNHPLSPILPYIPGKDGAGVVHQIGSDVKNFKKGDSIWFCGSVTGSYAEYCLCNEEDASHLPEKMTFDEGAMLGTPYLTASRALFQKAHVKEGMKVMVHGATGGVGTAAVQICQSLGIKVVATAGSAHGIDLLKSQGVDSIYNHHEEGYVEDIIKHEGHIDVILEMLANVNLSKDLSIIGAGGTIVIIGSRGPVTIVPRAIMSSECVVTGVMLFKSTDDEKKDNFSIVNKGIKDNWLKPVLWKTYDLEFAKDSHKEIIENNGARGQIILKIN